MMASTRRMLTLALAGTWALSATGPANASQMRYSVFWGGFHTADVTLSDNGGPLGYHASLDVATTGMAERLSRLSLQADTWGKAASRGALSPNRFSADSTSDDSETKLSVQFSPGAGLPAHVMRDVTLPLAGASLDDDKDPPPPVPAAQRVGTLDPLTALVELGKRAGAAVKGGPRSFTLPVYDGRRRYDARVIVKGPDSTEIDGRQVHGVAVQVVFTPIAGFRDSGREMWNNASFKALVDPATGLPLRIVSQDFTVGTVISAELPQAAAGN